MRLPPFFNTGNEHERITFSNNLFYEQSQGFEGICFYILKYGIFKIAIVAPQVLFCPIHLVTLPL